MLLKTAKLTKQYGQHKALDNLDLQIPQGEIFGLLGPNGSGKSTTIRLLLGMIQPTSGQAWIDGHDCWRASVSVRQRVAYLPGELRLYDNMTGRGLLRFLAGLRGQKLNGDVDRYARRFDIDVDRPIAHLSSGMKRKLALMQVLLPQVPLIILDEPTNTLDPTMRDELLDQLLDARTRQQTILFSSHILQEVERICDRVGILSRGKLVHLQSMQELRQGRFVRIVLAHAAQEPLPPDVEIQQQSSCAYTLICRHDPQPLLQWLGRQNVTEVRIEPLGLSEIYHRYHSNQHTERTAG